MKTSLERLDEEIENGIVTKATLKHFSDAESYGTAAPMQWLGIRLNKLESHVNHGHSILVSDGDSEVEISDLSSLHSWCSRHLPDAYACFYQSK